MRIDAVDYSVSETKAILLVAGAECSGRIDHNSNEIEISQELIGESRKKQVLMHEIVHGILYERGIGEMIAEEKQETFVDELSKGVTNLIRDNPELIAYIAKQKPPV